MYEFVSRASCLMFIVYESHYSHYNNTTDTAFCVNAREVLCL